MGATNYEDTDVLCTENISFPNIQIVTNSDSMMKLYTFRYWMVRSFTGKVKFLPYWLTGGKSLLEIMFVVSSFAITLVISQGWLNGKSSGQLAQDMACFMIIAAFRNNIFTIIFGISYERAIELHKAAGVLTILLGISHMILTLRHSTRKIEKEGIALLILFTVTSLSYLLKTKYFELFYAYHICSYFAILAMGYRHEAKKLVFTVVAWGFDVISRWYFGYHRIEAEITALPNDILKISFKKGFSYSPGQYCFLAVPALTHFQYHPFSISSAPHEDRVTFHVKALGNWTKDLHRLAATPSKPSKSDVEKGQEASEDAGQDDAMIHAKVSDPGPISKNIMLHLEGPYGLPSIDLVSGFYSVFILIGGGIGITPVQSIYSHLAHKYSANPLFLKKCLLVWSVRDTAMISSFEGLVDVISPAPTVSNVIEDGVPSEFGDDGTTTPGHAEKKSHTATKTIPTATPVSAKNVLGNSAFHKLINVTSAGQTDRDWRNYVNKSSQCVLSSGRPDYLEIFSQVASMCVAEKIGRVAVVACGPKSLVESVDVLCAVRHGGVAFDLHKESFDL